MKKFEIGSKVRVVESQKTYSSYEAWIIEHAHEYHERWYQTSAKKMGGHKVPLDGQVGTVLARAKHGDFSDMLYLVEIGDNLFIIRYDGLEQHEG